MRSLLVGRGMASWLRCDGEAGIDAVTGPERHEVTPRFEPGVSSVDPSGQTARQGGW